MEEKNSEKKERKMRDSGIPWIGEVPEGWECIKGKFIFTQRNERGNTKNLTLLSPTQKYGVIPQDLYEQKTGMNAVKLNEKTNLSLLKTIHAGDYCISLRSFQGGFEYSEYEGVVSPAYQVFYAIKDIEPRFYKYLFKDESFIYKMNSFTMSLRDGKNIAFSDFGNTEIPVPLISEQHRIADFLDSKCSKIDTLIENLRARVESAKEYKKAVITEAVTKGLDKDAKMKDSGVEWIGEVPEGWSFPKITHILDYTHPYPIGDGDHGSIKATDYTEYGIPFIRVQNLGFATDLCLDNVVYISEAQNRTIQNSTLKPNDILFAKTGATIGKVGIVPESIKKANTTSHVGKITVSESIVPKYIFYVLSSNIGYRQFWDIAAQKSTRPELSIDEIKTIRVLLPKTKEEQQQIADYLDSKCSEIDALLQNYEDQITTLEEYKKSLIYEYVTGKKEVPAA